jgi:hypothetical protein|tara:strand:+ start:18 stop:236 length:219 start_codon:yes stop_codon:yes gene_type:complete
MNIFKKYHFGNVIMVPLFIFLTLVLVTGCGAKQKFSCEFYNKDFEAKKTLEAIDGFKDDCVKNPQVQLYWSF